jgi:tRNA (guanine37-N1)-methyltransferase
MVKFNIITLFPKLFDVWSNIGICGRALERKNFDLSCWNPREYSDGVKGSIDDKPYGGGPGMVMMAEPLRNTLNAIIHLKTEKCFKVIFFSPTGKHINQKFVEDIVKNKELKEYVLVCGRYEGVDQRFIDNYVDEIWSLGDFVLSGGEYAAMSLMDAVIRRIPGSLGNSKSSVSDSFMKGLLQFPQYTRPEKFDMTNVPDVLLSGHHAKIEKWRRKKALEVTSKYRPDLVDDAITNNKLSKDDLNLLKEINLNN